MNLWACDLLQWNTQINTPPISETNHKLMYASERNINRHYQEHSLTIQGVHKQTIIAADLSEVPTVLPLKWLTNNPVWVEQAVHIRKITDIKTADTGAAKCSTY